MAASFLNRAASLATIGIICWTGYIAVETLWWTNAPQHYPSAWVGSAPMGIHDMQTLRQACGEPLETWHDGASTDVLVRCAAGLSKPSVWRLPCADEQMLCRTKG